MRANKHRNVARRKPGKHAARRLRSGSPSGADSASLLTLFGPQSGGEPISGTRQAGGHGIGRGLSMTKSVSTGEKT